MRNNQPNMFSQCASKKITINSLRMVVLATLLTACGASLSSSNSGNSSYSQKTFKKPAKAKLKMTANVQKKSAITKSKSKSKSGDGVFETVDIRELIQDVAVWTDKNVTIDRRLTGTIRIALPLNATATESYTAFRYAIKLKGWSIIETENVITITKSLKKPQLNKSNSKKPTTRRKI